MESVGRTVTIKPIHGGTGFGAGGTWELFSGQGGNSALEKEMNRLWGISGGFPDQVPVIVEITGIEAGCWGVVV